MKRIGLWPFVAACLMLVLWAHAKGYAQIPAPDPKPPFILNEEVAKILEPAGQFRRATDSILLPGDRRVILTEPLDLRDVEGLRIRGLGLTRVECQFSAPVAIDARGARHLVLEDFLLAIPHDRRIGHGFFLARRAARGDETVPPSSGFHRLTGVWVEGPTYGAAFAIVAAECNLLTHCGATQYGTGACVLIANHAPGIPLEHGNSTMLELAINDSWFGCVPATGLPESTSPIIRIVKRGQAAVGNIKIDGGGCGVLANRPAAIQLEDWGAAGQLQNLQVRNWRAESVRAKSVVRCLCDRTEGGDFTRVTIEDSTIMSTGTAVEATGQRLVGWKVSGIEATIVPQVLRVSEGQDPIEVANPYSRQAARPWTTGRLITIPGTAPATNWPTAANAGQTHLWTAN